jgi:hypothetical protein
MVNAINNNTLLPAFELKAKFLDVMIAEGHFWANPQHTIRLERLYYGQGVSTVTV